MIEPAADHRAAAQDRRSRIDRHLVLDGRVPLAVGKLLAAR